ncbi:MAG: hypothetical protein M0014_16615 [Actinomycetota bacterium]|nr:hypothetical protein [Actinomycetota bacterium]
MAHRRDLPGRQRERRRHHHLDDNVHAGAEFVWVQHHHDGTRRAAQPVLSRSSCTTTNDDVGHLGHAGSLGHERLGGKHVHARRTRAGGDDHLDDAPGRIDHVDDGHFGHLGRLIFDHLDDDRGRGRRARRLLPR